MNNRNRCASSIAFDSCGCQDGTEALTTPLARNNRPGLPALSYRIGTHASFLETMKARLSSNVFPELKNLTARDSSDPSIALLDAWAMVADVLTFYQERIANEGYIRTATEERSIQELARLVGAGQRSGVAATVPLAYTIDPNTKGEVVIPAGSRVQSVPGQNEKPQTFETSEDLKAYAELNVLKPRMSKAQKTILQEEPIKGKKEYVVYLKGVHTNLKSDDRILIEFNQGNAEGNKPQPEVYRVTTVMSDAKFDRTRVVLKCENNAICQKEIGRIFVFRTKTAPFGHNAQLMPIVMLDDKVMRYIEWNIERPIIEPGDPVAKFEIVKITKNADSKTVDVKLKNLSEGYFHTVTWLKKGKHEDTWTPIGIFKSKQDGFLNYIATSINTNDLLSLTISGHYGDVTNLGKAIQLPPNAEFSLDTKEEGDHFKIKINKKLNDIELGSFYIKITKRNFDKDDLIFDFYSNDIAVDFDKKLTEINNKTFDKGDYKITLTLENSNGISTYTATITLQPVVKLPVPIADFEAKLVEVNNINNQIKVHFKNISKGDVDKIEWQFPEGSPNKLTQDSPVEVYYDIDNNNVYKACLTIWSHEGKKVRKPTLSGFQTLNFTFFTYKTNISINNTGKFLVEFTDRTSGDGIIDREWYFGDGDSGKNKIESHEYQQYEKEKEYLVTMVVTRQKEGKIAIEKFSEKITVPKITI